MSYFSTNPGNSHSRKYFLHELLQAPSDHGASANVFITYLNHLIEELTFLFSKRNLTQLIKVMLVVEADKAPHLSGLTQ